MTTNYSITKEIKRDNMKKIFQYMAAGLLLLMTGTGCQDNENWRVIPYVPEPEPTINITGTATIYSEIGANSVLQVVELEQGDSNPNKTADITGIFTWLKKDGDFNIVDAGVSYGKGDVVATEPFETVKLKEGGDGFKVENDGLYFVVMNNAEYQLTVIPVVMGIMGDATPSGWNSETAMTMSYDAAGSKIVAKWSGDLANKQIKFRFSGDWGIKIPYGSDVTVVHANFGALGEDDGVPLGSDIADCKAGGKNFKIDKNGTYDVELNIDLTNQKVTARVILTQEGGEPALPEEMFITGTPYGWNWEKAYAMVPVHSHEGQFWAIQYMNAGDEIKFNNVRDWESGDNFGWGTATDEAVAYAELTDAGGNVKVGKAGWYMIIVTVTADKKTLDLKAPNVYLVGATAGDPNFGSIAADKDVFIIPTDAAGYFTSNAFAGDGDIRMCVKVEGADWWQTEFIFFDGQIAFRGNGNDQARALGTTGQKAYLNFMTGEGKAE